MFKKSLTLLKMKSKEMSEEYVYELPIKVRDYEVDAEGIVNNANYLHYLEVTRHESRGLDPVCTHIDIRYVRPLGLGDSMVSKLSLSRRGPVFVFRQDIFNMAGEPVVKAVVDIASFRDGRLSRGEELAEIFKDYLK